MIHVRDIFPFAATFALGFQLLACAPATDSDFDTDPTGDGDVSRDTRAIKGGSVASAYPESVLLNMKQGGQVAYICSAAVIAPRVVLTAGHCVHGIESWEVIAPYANGQTANSSEGVVYDWNTDSKYVDPNLHDIGLVFLDKDIVLDSYPKLSDSPIASGSKIHNIGRINNGKASYTNLYVSQPISIKSGSSVGFPYSYGAVETIESGDSGGPDVLPGPAPHTIVAVNSGAGGGTEVLARVDLLYSWIQDQIKAHGGAPDPTTPPAPSACAHDICAAGASLVDSCDPCATKICATDSYCCQTAWDSQCVSEVSSVCNATCGGNEPPPPPAPSTCAHDRCVTGAKLDASCDSCVADVCAADPYCCQSSWDSQCKGEVGSICGLSCSN